MDHTPLHTLDRPASVQTGGRLQHRDGQWQLETARTSVPVDLDTRDEETIRAGDLVRVAGEWRGDELRIRQLDRLRRQCGPSSCRTRQTAPAATEVVERRSAMARRIRRFFLAEDFREVETPNAVAAPGTDIYIDPLEVGRPGRDHPARYLHTSPEFAMKRLLSEGFERIFRLGKVWRDCEPASDRHHPEFTMLEWYRAWEKPAAVLEDVERIVREALDGEARVARPVDGDVSERTVDVSRPFERIAMRDLVGSVCGFDLLEALDYQSLRRACLKAGLLESSIRRRHPPEEGRWDSLFFELMVEHLEPRLAREGAVFLTDWPAPLAVLASRDPDDPRIADRFELYVGGVELANGFRELTDPDEQRRRFEQDLEDRRRLNSPDLPLPDSFLAGLEHGMPPATGVALGVDRLLMLDLGAPTIDDVLPLA